MGKGRARSRLERVGSERRERREEGRAEAQRGVGAAAARRDGTRGYALLAPSPAPTAAPVAPTTKPTAAPPPVVAPPAPAEGSDGAAATPFGVAAAVLALCSRNSHPRAALNNATHEVTQTTELRACY